MVVRPPPVSARPAPCGAPPPHPSTTFARWRPPPVPLPLSRPHLVLTHYPLPVRPRRSAACPSKLTPTPESKVQLRTFRFVLVFSSQPRSAAAGAPIKRGRGRRHNACPSLPPLPAVRISRAKAARPPNPAPHLSCCCCGLPLLGCLVGCFWGGGGDAAREPCPI